MAQSSKIVLSERTCFPPLAGAPVAPMCPSSTPSPSPSSSLTSSSSEILSTPTPSSSSPVLATPNSSPVPAFCAVRGLSFDDLGTIGSPVQKADIAACSALCRQNPECKGTIYINFNCYLTRNSPRDKVMSIDSHNLYSERDCDLPASTPSSASSVIATPTPTPSPSFCAVQGFETKDLLLKFEGPIRTANLVACSELCLQRSICQGVVYIGDEKNCYLTKNSPKGQITKSDSNIFYSERECGLAQVSSSSSMLAVSSASTSVSTTSSSSTPTATPTPTPTPIPVPAPQCNVLGERKSELRYVLSTASTAAICRKTCKSFNAGGMTCGVFGYRTGICIIAIGNPAPVFERAFTPGAGGLYAFYEVGCEV